MGKCATDDVRLFVDFLRHEMAVISLVDSDSRGIGSDNAAPNQPARGIMNFCSLVRHHDPIAVFEIADCVGERRERQRIGAEKHLSGAVADCKWRPAAYPDEEIVFAREQEGEGERSGQTWNCG